MYKYVLSFLCAVSLGHIPSLAIAQNLNGSYSDCSCVTPAISTAATAGEITFSNGNVLVDGVSAESNKFINANSQILVGEGSASINIGQSCQIWAPNNTQITISQPGGFGSNLCIQELDQAIASEAASASAGSGAIVGTVVIVGAAAAVVVAVSSGGDDDNNNAVVRPAASN